MKKGLKYFLIISLALILFAMVYINIFKEPNAMAKKSLTNIISKECIGVIEEVDDKQATIYYIVNGEKFSFGKVGREKIYYYATAGDSIIKRSNSKTIKIVKSDNKSKSEFEVY